MSRTKKQSFEVSNRYGYDFAGKLAEIDAGIAEDRRQVGVKYHRPSIDTKKVKKFVSNYCVSADYLVISALLKSAILDGLVDGQLIDEKYIFKSEFFPSAIYTCHATIKLIGSEFNYDFLHISWKPRNSYHDPANCQIKVNNQFLYDGAAPALIENFFALLAIEVKHITRLDICCDVHQLQNRLKPAEFIERFQKNRYVKRWSSSYHIDGKANIKLENHSIRFGSKNNPVSWYMYDKTKEMKDKRLKPWIVEQWKSCGMDTKKKIWRLEFVLAPGELNLLCDGKKIDITIKDVWNPLFLETIFRSLAATEMCFCYNNGKSRKDRMKTFWLLQPSNFMRYEHKKADTKDPTRTTRISLRLIETLYHEWRTKDAFRSGGISKTVPTLSDFMQTIIRAHGLQEWSQQVLSTFADNTVETLRPVSNTDELRYIGDTNYWAVKKHSVKLITGNLFK